MPDSDADRRLRQIKHIVVLMMENRSFDQMLGFLSKHDRVKDVNGLGPDGTNFNYDPNGTKVDSFEWTLEETSFHPPQDPTGKILDPCHSPDCVKKQLAEFEGVAPGGFIKDFVERTDSHGHAIDVPPEYRRLPMGYYSEKHLPVYDLLAREYCVCDAWHASIPGDTWPNRLYALAGEKVDPVRDKPGFWGSLLRLMKGRAGVVGKIATAPFYEVEAFTHKLADDDWRWYSHDPATLRCADAGYRQLHDLKRDNFTYFDRKRIKLETEAAEGLTVKLHDSFLDDAAKGQLRPLSWIDPNFIDLSIHDPNSNDDHPPSDVEAGQRLVLEVYEALVNSPKWEETMLIITYDEHGGFYDHEPAPPKPSGDPSEYETYGVRVPALVVGPHVENRVCKDLFEHTTLITTILRCLLSDKAEAAIADMPDRVQHASSLGGLIAAEPRAECLKRDQLNKEIKEVRTQLDQVRAEAAELKRARDGKPSAHPDGGAGQVQPLTDWQKQFMGFAVTMRAHYLPPGQP
jgi:phospholipase C